MRVYYNERDDRKAEKAFLIYLQRTFKEFQHVDTDYKLPEILLENFIFSNEIANVIENCNFISERKKSLSRDFLSKLPPQIKAANSINKLSVDFVIEKDNKLTFIEFHESQHSKLKDYRLKPIFSPNGIRYEVPRFLQRFIKDWWRWKYLKNYKIIWHDWFINNPEFILDLKNNNNEEFYLPNKFSFTSL